MPAFENIFESQDTQPAAPGRLIVNERPILFPSGAIREFYEIVITNLIPPMTYATYKKAGVRPGLDCSCQPQDMWDLSECSRCLSVTCLRHSGTCVLCGRVYCTGCLVITEVSGNPCVICRDCDKDLNTPKAIKLLQKLFWG